MSKWNLAQIGGEVRDEVEIAGARIDDAEIRHRRCFGELGEVSLKRWGVKAGGKGHDGPRDLVRTDEFGSSSS
jgi:hypothetical protein